VKTSKLFYFLQKESIRNMDLDREPLSFFSGGVSEVPRTFLVCRAGQRNLTIARLWGMPEVMAVVRIRDYDSALLSPDVSRMVSVRSERNSVAQPRQTGLARNSAQPGQDVSVCLSPIRLQGASAP
jgi:hypothetical protein